MKKNLSLSRSAAAFILPLMLCEAYADECCNWPDLRAERTEEDETSFRLGVSYAYSQTDSLQTGTRSISQPEARKAYDSRPTEMTSHRIETGASYAFSPRYELSFTLPWVRNTMSMQHFMSDHSACGDLGAYVQETQGDGYIHKMRPLEGYGDLLLEGSVRVLDEGDRKTGLHRLYLRPGLKTPTGDYKETESGYHTIRTPDGKPHRMKHGGGYMDPCMQPGTGSWDPIARLDYLFSKGRLSVTLSCGYQLTTRNSLGYEYGDAATAGVYPSFQIADWCGLTAGLRQRHIASAEDHAGRYSERQNMTKDTENTGGDFTDAILALDFFPAKAVVVSVGISLPVWSDVNGIQMEPGELYTCGASVRF